MGKFEDMSEQLAEARREMKAWKRRALGAEAKLAAEPAPDPHRRCTSISTANSGRIQCSRSSGHGGPHHDAWGALFWINHGDA